MTVRLEPGLDKDYLFEIAALYPYHIYDVKADDIDIYRGYTVFYNDVKCGCVFFQKIKGIYTFDAYKDLRLKNIPLSVSIEAGKQALDRFKFICNTINTYHNSKNRLATLVCKKIGFKEVGEYEFNDEKVRWLIWG